MTTIGTDDGRNYARINLQLVDRSERARIAEGPREARSATALKPIPGIELDARLQPADLGQPARSRSRDADAAHQRVRGEGREGAGHRRPRDVGEGAQPGAVDPPQQRRGGRPRHQRAAGRRDDPPAARRRHGELLARARRAELRGERAARRRTAASSRPTSRTCTSSTNKRGPDGELRMVPLRQVAEIVESTSPQIIKRAGAAAARRDLRERAGAARRATSARTSTKIIKADDAAARLSLRRSAARQKDMQESFQRGDGRARPRGDLHLPDPRVAVRELPAAGRDHGVAAALADRRVPRAAAHRHDAQHLLDDRLHHADGPRHQERDPAGRLRQSRAPRRRDRCAMRCSRRARCGCARS